MTQPDVARFEVAWRSFLAGINSATVRKAKAIGPQPHRGLALVIARHIHYIPLMATIFPRRLAVSAVVAFSLAAYAMSASAASVPAWHILHTVTGGSCAASSQFADVSASGPRDGWFVGQECSAGPRPLIQRWTGRGWRTVNPPKAVVSSVNEASVVSSSSAGNAWVFGFDDNTSSAVGLHWNGAKWTRTNFPAMSAIISAAVFSRTNAWAFGAIVSPFR